MAEPVEMAVRVDAGAGSDDEELAELTGWLRRELLDLDVESVEPPAGEAAPPGAKAVELAAVGALIVKLVGSGGIPIVVDTIRRWLAGSKQRSVKVSIGGDTLEVTGVSSDDQQRLIDSWLATHAAG